MNLRHVLTLACTLSLGASATAWAVPVDAGPTDVGSDATATAPDATSGDATTADTGVDTSKFDPCWVSKCQTEFKACQADPNCVALVSCNYDSTCIKAITGLAQADTDLGTAFQKCGGKACTDPTAGSCKGICGKFVPTDKCHCDDACASYGDCCADETTLCGGPASCAKSDCSDGSTGAYADGSDSANTDSQCGCDAACTTNQDCCADYDTTCKGKTPACVPACTNKDGTAKECGPDNCGGSCGTCKAGDKCTSGACVSGADAGTNVDSTTGGADASGTVDDTGTTGTAATTSSTAKSSGCTASTTGNGSAGWLSALVGLGFLVAMRRRRA